MFATKTLLPRLARAPLPFLAALLLTGARESASLAPADQPVEPRARPERVTSELVLIETYVNDLKGRPVRGLGPEDFVLMIDGKVAPIATVEFLEQGPPAGQRPPRGERAERPPTPAAVPQSPPRRFLLFFEDDTSSPMGLAMARRAAARFVGERLSAADQVAVVAHGRTLRPLSDFTTDHAALVRRLEESAGDRSWVSGFSAEVSDNEAGLRQVAGERLELVLQFSNYAERDAARYRRTMAALRSSIDALAPWPGYKAIIFLGDGIPDNPARYYLERLRDAPGVGRLLHELHSAARKADLSLEMKALIDAAGAAGVTLHTIATGGLIVDPEAGRPPQGDRGAMFGPSTAPGYGGSAAATLGDSMRADSLKTIALNTGGVASHSNDALRGLAEAEASSRAYYLLGYAPEGPPDGRAHTVQVRVKKITAEVRWRRGFTRLLPEEARARAVQAAHLLPELYATGALGLVAVPGPAEGSGRVVDLVVHVPPGLVLFLPEQGRPVAHLEVGLTALDTSGREALRLARDLRIAWTGDGSSSTGAGLNLVHRLRLPDAAVTATAVVEDRSARSLWAARLEVPAARAGDDPVPGLSIYSRSESSLWVEIEAAGSSAAGKEGAVAARLGPALKSRFTVGEPLLCGFRLPDHGKGGLALRLVLTEGNRTVADLPVDPETVTPDGIVKVPLPVDGLPAGHYRLQIRPFGLAGGADGAGVSFLLTPRPETVANDAGARRR